MEDNGYWVCHLLPCNFTLGEFVGYVHTHPDGVRDVLINPPFKETEKETINSTESLVDKKLLDV